MFVKWAGLTLRSYVMTRQIFDDAVKVDVIIILERGLYNIVMIYLFLRSFTVNELFGGNTCFKVTKEAFNSVGIRIVIFF